MTCNNSQFLPPAIMAMLPWQVRNTLAQLPSCLAQLYLVIFSSSFALPLLVLCGCQIMSDVLDLEGQFAREGQFIRSLCLKLNGLGHVFKFRGFYTGTLLLPPPFCIHSPSLSPYLLLYLTVQSWLASNSQSSCLCPWSSCDYRCVL